MPPLISQERVRGDVRDGDYHLLLCRPRTSASPRRGQPSFSPQEHFNIDISHKMTSASMAHRCVLFRSVGIYVNTWRDFPGGSVVKNPPSNAGVQVR